MARLPAAHDLRTLEQQARLAAIADPRLRQETSEFFSACYGPARDTEYDPRRPARLGPAHLQAVMAGRRAGPAQAPDRRGGRHLRRLRRAGGRPALASEQQHDALARSVLNNAPPVWSSNDLVAHNASTTALLGTAEGLVKDGLAAGGVVTASALFSVTMTAVLQALPMIQALLLLGVYALLPLVAVLSRYSLAMMVIGSMAIFTIKFWSVLWYLAMRVDQNLIQCMYPDVNLSLQLFAGPPERSRGNADPWSTCRTSHPAPS